MSSGHHAQHGREPSEIKRTAALAAIEEARKRKRKIDRDHDVPYLAGYSKDGKTIYVDRHLPKSFKFNNRELSVDRFLEIHEEVEKTLIDELGWGYWPSHHVATWAEENAVRDAGIDRAAYEKALKPYIKADEHEKLIKVPSNLDLTPYKAKPVNTSLLAHLEKRMSQ